MDDRSFARLHADDQATCLLERRRVMNGSATVAALADEVGFEVHQVESLLCRAVSTQVEWGWSREAICTEYNFTDAQVAEAIRRTALPRPPSRRPGAAP